MATTDLAVTSPTQEKLAAFFAARSAWVGRPPAAACPGDAADTIAIVLLRTLDLAGLVHGTREFAAGLDTDEADAWRRSWTRTRFLVGIPANLTWRTPARVTAPGGSMAWLGPFHPGRLPGLSRLLKPVTGAVPRLPVTVDLPGTGVGVPARPLGPRRELHVALRHLTLAEYFVHVHHTLAESVLQGRLRADEPLRLVHRTDIDADRLVVDPAYVRVHYERGDSSRLRLYTWLSPAGADRGDRTHG